MSIFTNTHPYAPAEVTDTREIVLAAIDPDTGMTGEVHRFRLDPQIGIQPVLTGLFPPAISIGDAGRDNQPFASTDSHDDFSGGVGVHVSQPETQRGRYWWGTVNTRKRRDTVLLPLKTDRGNPHGGATPLDITCGCGFQNVVVVCVGPHIYVYDPSNENWTTAIGTPTTPGTPFRTLAATPTSDPVEWDGNLYFFTGNTVTRWTGSAFVNIANDAIAGTVWGGQMWLIDANGTVEKSANQDLTPATVVTTAALFTDDVVTGMTVYLNAEGAVVPYIIGRRRLYSIDPTTNVIYPTGPKMPPHRFPITVAEFGGDRQMYIAQAMSVLQWGGDLAQDIGLTQDDGVPASVNGSIRKIVADERDIYLLTTRPTGLGSIFGDGQLADTFADFEVGERPVGYSSVMVRSGSGWHPLAVADADDHEASAMWVSYTPERYRLWFCWGRTVYSLDLEYGLPSPNEMVPSAYEPSGYLVTPWQDFTYKEDEKIVLLVSIRARFPAENESYTGAPCRILPYIGWDDDDNWEELRAGQDGAEFGIVATGRTDIKIHADPFPPFNDQPASGRSAGNVRLKLNFERGDRPDCTPRLIAYTIHCLKVTPALMGWAAVIDMTDEWRGVSPDRQWFNFLHLLRSNEGGLLHYAYTDTETGEPGQLWPVKITGVTGVQNTGPLSAGKVRVSFSEVIHAAGE